MHENMMPVDVGDKETLIAWSCAIQAWILGCSAQRAQGTAYAVATLCRRLEPHQHYLYMGGYPDIPPGVIAALAAAGDDLEAIGAACYKAVDTLASAVEQARPCDGRSAAAVYARIYSGLIWRARWEDHLFQAEKDARIEAMRKGRMVSQSQEYDRLIARRRHCAGTPMLEGERERLRYLGALLSY